MSLGLHFADADWERIERDYTAWWAHELPRPLVYLEGSEPDTNVAYPEMESFVTNYPWELPAEEIVARVTAHMEAVRYYGDAYPRWFVNMGPGILAAFLGAQVHSVPNTVWFSPAEMQDLREMHLHYRAENRWWQRAQDLTRAAVTAWGAQVQVSHTDLGGNLDVLASLRTTEGLLLDLYDAPEEIDRLAREVTNLWLEHYDRLDAIIQPADPAASRCRGRSPWAPIWSHETTYMFQSDFAYMISPAMFERYVIPDLVACCDHIEHGFYHLDGPAQIQHLDVLLEIPRLRGIQWIPGDGNPAPDQWLDVLNRIIAGGKLCQVYVSAEGALRIVRNLGGKGFLLAIQDNMKAAEAAAFLAHLSREDISPRG
jgi:hypothetical protein